MTPARIKAIRFFFKETPTEFAERLIVAPLDVAFWETGQKKPSKDDLINLAWFENVLNLRGVTTEIINEREDLYKSAKEQKEVPQPE